MNYLDTYKQQTGFDIPKGFEVHHIDLNHENNDVKNLVAIPKWLHQKYHGVLPSVQSRFEKGLLLPKNDFQIGGAFIYDVFENWIELTREINKYIRLRDCFLNSNNEYNFEYWLNTNDVKDLHNEIYNNN